jgi:hypothetical protein
LVGEAARRAADGRAELGGATGGAARGGAIPAGGGVGAGRDQGSGCRARGGGGETLGQQDLGEVECLRRMPARKAGGSGEAGKKKRGETAVGRGLVSN